MSKIIFTEVGTKPPAPSTGQVSMYAKTDEVVYIQDSSGVELPLGSSSAITVLSGDVSATGPGPAVAVVNSVGGSSAANIHSAELIANAATTNNTASTVVKRDASGNFAAGTITASLNGNASTATTLSGSFTGDVTGTQSATVVSTVGGSAAADIHTAELAANAATSTNTASTIVERDASGNFSAHTITANLSGNATNVSGVVAVANGGTNSSTALNNNRILKSSGGAIVESAAITSHRALASDVNGIPVQSSTTDTELDYVSGVTSSIQTQINSITGSGITSLVGDVTGTGPGATTTTVASVGGSSAANIHSAELAANAATASNTNSTIVERDASGNFSASQITASLVGNVMGNVSGSSDSFTGNLLGDITGTQSSTSVSKIQGTSISGTTGSGNVVLSASPTLTGTLAGNAANFSSTVTASNISGSNTGDVTTSNTNSVNLAFSSGQTGLTASLNLSSDAADSGNLKATTTVHSGSSVGLHVEYPFGVPVQIGTTNVTGSAVSFSLSDHVHALTPAITTGQALTGYVTGSNTPITATNTILTAFENLQAQVSTTSGSAISNLTGDVTASGPGSVAATIAVGAVTDTKASLANKPAVTVVATTNQTLSGSATIDGQTTTVGVSIVLATAQSTASQNGPWIVQTGAWTRPSWYPSGGTSQAFQFITMLVRLGTVFQGSTWRLTTSGAITIDTTSTTWAVTPEKGNYAATYTIGTQAGSSEVDLVFSNANQGTLGWNPSSSFKLVLPAAQGASGTYLSNDGSGNLSWSNPMVNIDGGTANSTYVSSQFISGGTP